MLEIQEAVVVVVAAQLAVSPLTRHGKRAPAAPPPPPPPPSTVRVRLSRKGRGGVGGYFFVLFVFSLKCYTCKRMSGNTRGLHLKYHRSVSVLHENEATAFSLLLLYGGLIDARACARQTYLYLRHLCSHSKLVRSSLLVQFVRARVFVCVLHQSSFVKSDFTHLPRSSATCPT